MKQQMREKTAILLIYSLLMLSMMIVTVFALIRRTPAITATEPQPITKSIKEYVYVYEETESTQTQPIEEEIFIVKECESKIGIFTEEGVLLELLEVYTKTLPQADQGLLREGIVVTTRSALYALIEDYSE